MSIQSSENSAWSEDSHGENSLQHGGAKDSKDDFRNLLDCKSDGLLENVADLNSPNDLIRGALAKLRKQLLDLTAHNPLISFKHSGNGRFIRIVDELPNNISDFLQDGKELTFAPIPEPNDQEIIDWKESGGELLKKRPPVNEWASKCGISNSYDLPIKSQTRDRRHTDSKLQTLLYPDSLEAKVSDIYRLSRTMVEETGTNPLHLVFGFLEWYESGDSSKAHFAPLYTLPVALEKGSIDQSTNTYQYTLRLGEGDVQFNASISARLVDDYAFVIPEINSEQSPEDYLNTVASAILPRFPRWKVHRWGTLAMLNFSRLMMFRDLDPDNWPEGDSLDKHPLVKGVIEGVEFGQERGGEITKQSSNPDEYHIDSVESVYENFPLVDVADSSQHSALIDALNGKNLVIQGPPGTGKSQTITNLIAAALQKGKSVLFVSEKLAALDVVKNRMTGLGLGDFCLELHSHNTKKIGVVASLRERLDAVFRDTRQLEFHNDRHQKLAEELNQHAERVNRLWKKSEMTVLEILVQCVRSWRELKGVWEEVRISKFTGDSWNPQQRAETLGEFAAYAKQMNKIASDLNSGCGLVNHPWYGIRASEIDLSSAPKIISHLDDWSKSLDSLVDSLSCTPCNEDLITPTLHLSKITNLNKSIAVMPTREDELSWQTLDLIRKGGLREVDEIIGEVDKLAGLSNMLGNLNLEEIVTTDEIQDLSDINSDLLKKGISPDTKISELDEIWKASDNVLIIISKWIERFEQFKEFAAGNIPPFLDPQKLTFENLRKLQIVINMNGFLSPDDLSYRDPNFLPSRLKENGEVFIRHVKELRKSREMQRKIFDLNAVCNLDLSALIKALSKPTIFRRLLSSEYRKAKIIVKAAMRDSISDWHACTIVSLLEELENYLSAEKSLKSDDRWRILLGSTFNGVDTDIDRFARLISWSADLERFFITNEDKLFASNGLDKSGEWLLYSDVNLITAIQRFEESGFTHDHEHIHILVSKVISVFGLVDIPNDSCFSDPDDIWKKMLEYLRDILPLYKAKVKVFRDDCPLTLSDADKRLNGYVKIREDWVTQILKLNNVNARCFSGCLPSSPHPTILLKEATDVHRKWSEWLDNSELPQSLVDSVMRQASSDFIIKLRSWNDEISSKLLQERSMCEVFTSFVSLKRSDWGVDGSIQSLRVRVNDALKSQDLLADFLVMLGLRAIISSKGFSAACKYAEQRENALQNYKSVFDYLISATLADEIFESEPALRKFNGLLHNQKLEDFRQCDRDLMKQTQIRTAASVSRRYIPTGYRGAKVSENTELALITREIEKQKRHIPLRQLILRAGSAIQALKPCFMMGPRSVAQYLQPGAIKFDLLVIDEASQMRPADALGAIARCNQLVVVGDSKQLAPSSFFDRAINDEEDDDETFSAVVSESILDAVAPIFTRRQLRWHYRSKHPSLIAFSNRQFYDNRLMLFPSPHFGNEALGICFQHITDGVFENQVNSYEAIAVAERVVNILLENSHTSLGVATMNSKQRDLIQRLLEDSAKKDDAFAKAWEINQTYDEPLFIKNLENVQGDEREIMIISCTYGKNSPGGRVMQRFGPINSSQGGRRLNVLFTRSRSRMEIFSSMVSSDVILSESSSEGLRALRGMLRYAETGIIEGALASGREPDSDFEVAVANMLEEYGYEVECQIGVAGFFIDLAVKHPKKNGEYILGIECDGAAYHSSKSARDRDRIRQDILESMGWTIERIWSTDWFRDPKKAIKPVLQILGRIT